MLACVAALCCVHADQGFCAADETLSVDFWNLRSRVDASGVGSAIDGTNTVQNPFHKLDHAELTLPGGATSTADTEYHAAWDAAGFFHFLAEGQHAAAGHNGLFSRSTGVVFFTPRVDSILSLNLLYNYALGNGDREAFVSLTVAQEASIALLLYTERRLTLLGQNTGQIAYEPDEIPLFANVPYAVQYRLEIESFSGSPSVLSTGNGSVQFTVTPIPEPATLSLILPALLLIRRTRRRSNRGRDNHTTGVH